MLRKLIPFLNSKKIILLFLLFFFSIHNSFGFDINKIKKAGYKDIEIEIRVEDTDREELLLPLKATWKNKTKKKTYKSINFLKNSLVSLNKKIPKNETYGYLYIGNSTKAIKDREKVFRKTQVFRIKYNFEGKGSTKRELYFLQLEKDGDYYKVKKFYSKSDLIKHENEEIKKANVVIKGKVSSGFLGKGTVIGLYNKRGESLYSTYAREDGTFTMDLYSFKDKIELDKDYFLIYGKNGDVEEGVPGFLYTSKKYTFKSYIDLIKTFKPELFLNLKINIKDKPVLEAFPYTFALFFIFLYTFIIYQLQKRLIKKIITHPNYKKHNVFYEKRKKIILKLKNEGLGLIK